MIIEKYEALAHERSDEDILVDGLLEELIEAGHSVIRHDPAAEPEAFEAPQIVELLETYALPYFFKDGSLCFTGSYDLNGLNRKISCGGCLGGGCSGGGQGCPKQEGGCARGSYQEGGCEGCGGGTKRESGCSGCPGCPNKAAGCLRHE